MLKGEKLSTEPYKGVRDFYPEDMFIQNYIFDTMREVVERFGYSEYSASLLEPAELYEAKTSEEIVGEQTYTFTDRGDRRVTLRPEMTPSVARMVAAKKRELSFPLRLYAIPNVFRYERPQKGRLREHWQLNADIFGVEGIEADTEIITLAHNIMKAFGASDDQFVIKVSSRDILNKKLEEQGLNSEQKKNVYKVLDKKGKIDDFEQQLEAAAGKKPDLSIEPSDAWLLKEHFDFEVDFDASIVRGFDYYTGVVFEVFDTSSENKRSLFGGGRYDNLLTVFGGDSVPAVGFGMGDVTIADFLETHDLLPEYVSTTDLYLCTTDKSVYAFTKQLAESLRKHGLNVAVDYSDKKVGDQVKNADKQRIPFIICVGEEEMEKGLFSVKNLKTGEEKSVEESGIADLIWSTEL